MEIVSNETDFVPSNERTELLLGCGKRRDKEISFPPDEPKEFNNLVTLDLIESSDADFIHDLEQFPYPFDDDSFDEIHAYEVLEHTGAQGDYKFFFKQFDELWRILKPGGFLMCSTPMWDSQWAWGDPGHKRIISQASLVFLERKNYESQPSDSPMADYRGEFVSDWEVKGIQETDDRFYFVMQAKK